MEVFIVIYELLIGKKFVGWYIGCISFNILVLLVECDDILYCVDFYVDDLLYYDKYYSKLLLMVFYMLDINDM